MGSSGRYLLFYFLNNFIFGYLLVLVIIYINGTVTVKQVVTVFGPVYTKRESQRCDDFPMTLSNLFSLKAMESLQIGVATHSGATPLFSMGTQSLVSSQLMPR